MSFNNFCNICFIKEQIIKLCLEENESILNILISFASSRDPLKGIIYLCINCCNKLEECNKFRELFLTNFVRFRYLYSQHKKKLEISNAPDIETKLKAFVNINVERPSGTPLIENYDVAHALINDTTCNVDITYKEFDGEFPKIDLHKLLNKNDSSHALRPENFISESEPKTCQVKCENDSFDEDQDNINSIYIKDEPNPDHLEESHDQLVIDSVANVIPCHESTDDDIFDVSLNLENCVTYDSTDKAGSTENGNKTTTGDTVCNVCDESFSCTSDLEVHRRTHSGEKYYMMCNKCNKPFTDGVKLINHKRFQCSKKLYKCNECGLRYTLQCNLTRHKNTHSGEKPYKCNECSLRFSQQSHLNTHKNVHSGNKLYKCDECGLGVKQKSYLKIHKLIHTGEKPYKCDECGLAFNQNSNLKIHKLIHTGEKHYKCDECGLRFSRRANLNIHKNAHIGEKPYKCDECSFQFLRRSQLNRHKLTHTGEKPHKCDDCGFGFTERSSLKKHRRIHTGEKPYKCDECGFVFTRRDSLNLHKKVHTGEKPYKCDECGAEFLRRSQLRRHERRHTLTETVYVVVP